MKKIILICCLLLTNILLADNITAESKEKKLILLEQTGLINNTEYNYCKIDKESIFDPISIKNNTTMSKMSKSNLGYISDTYWCKFQIVNNSNKTKTYILTNPRPGVDYIDVTVFKDDKISKEYLLGDMLPLENRSYTSVFSNFELELEQNQSATIVSKYQTVGNLEVSWNIQELKAFLEYENLNFILIFIFFGFVFALMIYKAFFFIYLKDSIYLVYTILLFSVLVSQASLQGSLHYFLYDLIDYKTITLSSWIFTHIFLVAMWIFTYQFFNINKKSKFHLPFKIIISYNIVVTLIYCFAYVELGILKITPLILLTALIESLLLLIFAVIMVIQRKPGSNYFLIGHLLYVISVIYYILILSGNLEFSLLYRHITPLGLFMVIVFMSMALSKRFQILKHEIDKNKDYVTIGKTIAFVAHEWKQPISILSSQVMNISAKIDHYPNEPIGSLDRNLKDINNSISLLNNILDSVKKIFLSEKIEKETFIFQEFIKEINDYFSDQLSQKRIKLSCIVSREYKVNSDRELLFQVIKNIIQNSIDAYDTASYDNEIKITVEYSNFIINKIIIDDNAGGIKVKKTEDIFEPSISTKKSNMGIGLSIVKHIITEKLNSNISMKNIENGTRFIVKVD